MTRSTTPNFFQAALALLLLVFGALGGCFSSPTPHPGVEGEANGGRGDVTDPSTGVSDPDAHQDSVPEGPPCAPGDVVGGDGHADAGMADAGSRDAVEGDTAGYGADCGVTDPDPDSDGVSSPGTGTGN